jgi:hypothetical protein
MVLLDMWVGWGWVGFGLGVGFGGGAENTSDYCANNVDTLTAGSPSFESLPLVEDWLSSSRSPAMLSHSVHCRGLACRAKAGSCLLLTVVSV